MHKRSGQFESSDSKKAKIDNGDNLWGDDSDIDDVQLVLATEVCEKQVNTSINHLDISIMPTPTYNSFKRYSNNVFTSTQNHNIKVDAKVSSGSRTIQQSSIVNRVGNNVVATNNKILSQHVDITGIKRPLPCNNSETIHLESKVKKLEEQYEEKVGEVSILRSQLEQLKTSTKTEHDKKLQEWSEKLVQSSKQMNIIQSELEFKNLEIANLKQKVVEVSKFSNLDFSINLSQSVNKSTKYRDVPRPSTTYQEASSTSKEKDYKLHINVDQSCPLQNIPSSIFTCPKLEKYVADIQCKLNRSTIPYLQNQMSENVTNKLFKLQPKITFIENEKPLNISYLYCDIVLLMKCTADEINSEIRLESINKVICVSYQLLYNLHDFIKELDQSGPMENELPKENRFMDSELEETNMTKAIFSSKQWCSNEVGISARQTLGLISEMLPYSQYLRYIIIQNKFNKFLCSKKSEKYIKFLPAVASALDGEDGSNGFKYLQLIFNIICLIRKTNRSYEYPGFLSAVAMLLKKICICDCMKDKTVIIITREMLFAQPTYLVLHYITDLFKAATKQKLFVKKLCSISKNSRGINKKTVLCYNKDTCILQIFYAVIEKNKNKIQSTEFQLNILGIVTNILYCKCVWLHYEENKFCDCISKIIKLFVEAIYNYIEEFKKVCSDSEACNDTEKIVLFKNAVKVLHALNYKYSDLIIKSVETYSEFKVILKSLLDMQVEESIDDLIEDLNVSDEIPMLHETSFTEISVWNQMT